MASSRVLRHAAVLATSGPRTSRACSSGFRPILAHRPSIVSRIPASSHHPRAYSSHSDQTVSPLARSVITATRAIRNILIVSTSTLTLGLFVWAGSHAYLEQYKCPSPPGCSSTVRNCLHGAWVREEIAPDPDVAEVYLQKALELTRQELEDMYEKKYKDDHQHDMTRFLEIEKDLALVEIQNRLARFYGRIGQHEQAATIWTRLWRMAGKPNPRELRTTSSTKGFSLSSLFGALTGSGERPLVTEQDGVQFAKRAADSWMHVAEYDLAEEALAWTLSHAAPSNRGGSTESSVSIEEIGLLSTLGALYVRQGKFEYALSLFVKALQAVQEHQKMTAATHQQDLTQEERNLWFCREAILTSSIGETLFGAAAALGSSTASSPSIAAGSTSVASSSWKLWSSSSTTAKSSKVSELPLKSAEQVKKEEEALGWMQKAIMMAKEKSGQHRDCDECAALGLSNLGLISEMEGKNDEALSLFREAVVYATKAKDYVGIDDYNGSIARLTATLTTPEDTTPSTPPSPA